MDEHTDDRPKAFLELGERTLYKRQREVLRPHVDGVTVVLGYEAEAVRGDLAAEDRALVFENWRDYENGESLRRALADLPSTAGDGGASNPDGVVVLNGDVVVAPGVVGELRRRHREYDTSVVGCLPGRQSEHTPIRCARDGRVTDYGELAGHRHAGLGVVDGADVPRARRFLREHGSEWYPVVYPELGARRVFVPAEHHVEINRPAHLREARRRLPFEESDPGAGPEPATTGDRESP